MKFAKEAYIDLIFASSVFTHISLDLLVQWLEELHRILRPGGIFLCTVLGERYIESMLGQDDREVLAREGSFEMDLNTNAFPYPAGKPVRMTFFKRVKKF